MKMINIFTREELNRMRLSKLNFNQVCEFLDESLDRGWNEKVPNHPIPFKAFCRTDYANKHLIESCIMVEGDVNGSNVLTGVVLRFYFRNNTYNFNINNTDSKMVTNENNKSITFSVYDKDRHLQYIEGDDARLNLILKEYRRLVNPLEIKSLLGKIEIIGYDLYSFLNPISNDRTTLEMLHDIYTLENQYLEIFDNLK